MLGGKEPFIDSRGALWWLRETKNNLEGRSKIASENNVSYIRIDTKINTNELTPYYRYVKSTLTYKNGG